jgi:hypothetical protein
MITTFGQLTEYGQLKKRAPRCLLPRLDDIVH